MHATPESSKSLEDLRDIRQFMERSSRFISLSGLSGIAAGICALIGVYFAYNILEGYEGVYNSRGFLSGDDFSRLKIKLVTLGAVVFCVAFILSYYLTWRKARKQGLPVWDHTSRRLAWNMILPLVGGGVFIAGMIRYDIWIFVSSACLIFYGLALINASKYTLDDIRFLGYCELILGMTGVFFPGYGLWFWALGFGVLHIVYGIVMWNKYERSSKNG